MFGVYSACLSLNLSLRSSPNSFWPLSGHLQTILGHWTSHSFHTEKAPKQGIAPALHEVVPWMPGEFRPGAAFLCYLPFPIKSQCSSLIVRDIMWVLMILLVYITQRCSATCLLPITKREIEIIILCAAWQIWLYLAAMPFESILAFFLLIEKSLPASSQVLDDAGGGIWATRRRHTRLGITAGSQFTSICPSLLQAKGWVEGCMQELIRINAPSNSTMRNRLCRKHKHRDNLGNVHGD